MLDLSNYPKDLKFFDPSNEKFIDKMKDESKAKINDEFVGLKSMIHSIKNVDGGKNKRRKGINQSVLKKINMKNIVMFCLIKKWWDITWKEFKVNCIEFELMMIEKIICLFFDDKRYILNGGINTFSCFHKDTRSQ